MKPQIRFLARTLLTCIHPWYHLNIIKIHTNYKKTKEYIPSAGSGLGVGAEGAAGEKNMHDAEFTCALFRFIQLTCEGHNLGECFFVCLF